MEFENVSADEGGNAREVEKGKKGANNSETLHKFISIRPAYGTDLAATGASRRFRAFRDPKIRETGDEEEPNGSHSAPLDPFLRSLRMRRIRLLDIVYTTEARIYSIFSTSLANSDPLRR